MYNITQLYFLYLLRDSLSFLIEELKEPAKNLPRAVFISIPLVTVVYLLANVSYFTVVSPDELAESVAVAMVFLFKSSTYITKINLCY